ncbi:Uma2 family endonuclease [Candidatus Poribacteria bacterium]|nr:Uma2 family endonuclease [Candidatus Poribacteria bacterium]
MGEVGILKEDERVELIDGIITKMNPIGSEHAGCVNKLNRHFSRALSLDDATIGVQNPIVLDDGTEPEPDLALLKPREDAYADAHPRPANVLLVVEVADTTIEEDRTVKLPRYAAAGIPEVWLVNIPDRRIEVYQTPGGTEADAGYKIRVEYRPGEMLAPGVFPDVKVGVSDILPVAG